MSPYVKRTCHWWDCELPAEAEVWFHYPHNFETPTRKRKYCYPHANQMLEHSCEAVLTSGGRPAIEAPPP